MSETTQALAPFQMRVITEKSSLDTKIARLKNFMAFPTFLQMKQEDNPQAKLLEQQLHHMLAYSEVLAQRIELFKAEPA